MEAGLDSAGVDARGVVPPWALEAGRETGATEAAGAVVVAGAAGSGEPAVASATGQGRRREAARFGHAADAAHQGGVLDHHRDGGTGNAVDGYLAFHAAADDHFVEHGFALVLPGKLLQAFLGDAYHEDGFLVLDDADADDLPGEIETDQRIDGMAGVGRDANDVGRQVGIAEQLFAPVNGGGRRIAFDHAEAVGLREKALHRRIARIDGPGARRDRHAHEQAQHQQAQDNGREFHEILMRRGRHP
jgi:hypothetical protein